jgi:hypothetical protein
MYIQVRNHWENLGATAPMVGTICPPPLNWNKIKLSENLGETVFVPITPAYKIKGQERHGKILMFRIWSFAELVLEALQNWYLLSTLISEIQTV